MKIKFGFIVFLILFFVSCAEPKRELETLSVVETDVVITKVSVAKYSTVYGYAIYNGLRIPVRNSKSGYYYRKYSIHEGETVKMTVSFYAEGTWESTNISAFADFNTFCTNP